MAPLSEGIFCADYALFVKFENHSYCVFDDNLDALVSGAASQMERDGYHLSDLIEGHLFRTARAEEPNAICLCDIAVKDGQWEFEPASDPNREIWSE